MSTTELKALVLAGDGINCERETAQAFRIVGFQPEIRHLNDAMAEHLTLDQLSKRYAVIALPGGFSFGDDLTSGRVLALKLRYGLGWELSKYVERGGLVLGVCNGFQALLRMGVFGKGVSITSNASGRFINRWVSVTPQGNRCVWLKGLGAADLPIRHGEGRLVFQTLHKKEVVDRLERFGMTCLRYDQNPNGSEFDLAGLCDASGRIFGLMPHPEAFVRWTAHPHWTHQPARASAPGAGLVVFENAWREAKGAHG